MTPLKLLERELKSFERDLEKSKEAYDNLLISKERHELIMNKITPKIVEYKNAIKHLQ